MKLGGFFVFVFVNVNVIVNVKTQSLDIAPRCGVVPHIKPAGKALLSLTAQHTIDLRMLPKKSLIIAQELRSSEDNHRLWQQCLHTRYNMQ